MKSTAVALATLALLAALAGCGASATPDASVTPHGTTSAGPHGKLCLSAGTPPRITWTTVPPRNADTPRPAQLDQGSFGDQFEQLHARSVDPAPVTIAQAFPRRPVLPSAGCGWPGIPSVSYATRKYAQAGRDCGAAVWGAALKRALMLAGCSQALRAAYRTNVGNYVGMMALLNLRDSVGATQVANLLAPDVLGTVTNPGSSGFLLPLNPPAWLTVLGKGYSESRVYVAGHYVLVKWVARADGKQPSNDFWNLQQLSSLLSLPPGFAARGHRIPPVVVRIYVSRGHPSRCVMPTDVPLYSSLNIVITGNTRASYDVPVYPGETSGDQASASLGTLGGGSTSYTSDDVTVFSQPGTYVFHVSPAPQGLCELVVR
jgi:hypothetical protein